MSTFCFYFFLVTYIIVLLNIFGLSQAYFETCEQTVNIGAGQTTAIQSPGYSAGVGYNPGSSCRYTIIAPVEYQIRASCNINMYDEVSIMCTVNLFVFKYFNKLVNKWKLLHSAFLFRS